MFVVFEMKNLMCGLREKREGSEFLVRYGQKITTYYFEGFCLVSKQKEAPVLDGGYDYDC